MDSRHSLEQLSARARRFTTRLFLMYAGHAILGVRSRHPLAGVPFDTAVTVSETLGGGPAFTPAFRSDLTTSSCRWYVAKEICQARGD